MRSQQLNSTVRIWVDRRIPNANRAASQKCLLLPVDAGVTLGCGQVVVHVTSDGSGSLFCGGSQQVLEAVAPGSCLYASCAVGTLALRPIKSEAICFAQLWIASK